MTGHPVVGVGELAREAPGLDLDVRGSPAAPMLLVDVAGADRLAPAVLLQAGREALRCLPLVIGLAPAGVGLQGPPELAALLRALDVTLTDSPGAPRTTLDVAALGLDLPTAVEEIGGRVAAAPRAAVLLGGVLRQTERLGVRAGLLAESAAYSTLLAGPEFAGWLARRGPPRPPHSPVVGPLLVEREGDVLRVTLTRPERRNAVDAVTRDALVDAFAVAVADPRVRVELRGEGPDFCAGGDLDEFGATPDPATAHLVRSERSVGWLLHRLRARTTVWLQGFCLGAGLELPAFAGTVIAASGTRLGLPELALGLIPGAGGTVSVARRIGRHRTLGLTLSGRPVDALTAAGWGLVDHVVPAAAGMAG